MSNSHERALKLSGRYSSRPPSLGAVITGSQLPGHRPAASQAPGSAPPSTFCGQLIVGSPGLVCQQHSLNTEQERARPGPTGGCILQRRPRAAALCPAPCLKGAAAGMVAGNSAGVIESALLAMQGNWAMTPPAMPSQPLSGAVRAILMASGGRAGRAVLAAGRSGRSRGPRRLFLRN